MRGPSKGSLRGGAGSYYAQQRCGLRLPEVGPVGRGFVERRLEPGVQNLHLVFGRGLAVARRQPGFPFLQIHDPDVAAAGQPREANAHRRCPLRGGGRQRGDGRTALAGVQRVLDEPGQPPQERIRLVKAGIDAENVNPGRGNLRQNGAQLGGARRRGPDGEHGRTGQRPPVAGR